MTIAEQYEWAKDNAVVLDEENAAYLDMEGLPIQVDIKDIDKLPNEQYALLRKNGFGCSDSSALAEVNPYKTKEELIEEKCRSYLTEEEKAVGDKSAVKKGRDLEPFVIQKYSQLTGRQIIKPKDMYRNIEFPYLTVNFDGVMIAFTEDGEQRYIPDEIKICTMYGAKHYDRTKAMFRESIGIKQIPSPELATMNASIQEKAARYGVPPYYYTQTQMEMFNLNAPFGYLTVLFEKEWELCSWLIWQDTKTQHQIILEASKAWDRVAQAKNLTFDDNGLLVQEKQIVHEIEETNN